MHFVCILWIVFLFVEESPPATTSGSVGRSTAKFPNEPCNTFLGKLWLGFPFYLACLSFLAAGLLILLVSCLFQIFHDFSSLLTLLSSVWHFEQQTGRKRSFQRFRFHILETWLSQFLAEHTKASKHGRSETNGEVALGCSWRNRREDRTGRENQIDPSSHSSQTLRFSFRRILSTKDKKNIVTRSQWLWLSF